MVDLVINKVHCVINIELRHRRDDTVLDDSRAAEIAFRYF